MYPAFHCAMFCSTYFHAKCMAKWRQWAKFQHNTICKVGTEKLKMLTEESYTITKCLKYIAWEEQMIRNIKCFGRAVTTQ